MMSIQHRLSQFLRWLKAMNIWLADMRHLWMALIVAGVAIVISLRPGTSEAVIRLTGMALQILGVATVAWGISETRALFGRPSFVSVGMAWMKRLPKFRPTTVSASVNVTLPGPHFTARGYGMDSAGSNPTIEDRLETLEKNLGRTNNRINEVQRELDAGFRAAQAFLTLEEQSRATGDNAIRQKLEATGTGGVHISAIGALWLLVGVVLSTAAPEISRLLL